MGKEKKKRYYVNLTMIYNGSVEVEATSADEAIAHVNENMSTLTPDDSFSFGEKTVDYADLIEE